MFYTGLHIQGNLISISMESIITIYCPMRFDNFPMDKQHCPFQIGSYKFNSSYMKFHLIQLHDLNEYQTSVLDYMIQKTMLREKYSNVLWQEGGKNYTFSCTGFEIHMQRKTQNYIVDFYLPSCLMVSVSWVRKIQGKYLLNHVLPLTLFR